MCTTNVNDKNFEFGSQNVLRLWALYNSQIKQH
jgi:hypothetical protein